MKALIVDDEEHVREGIELTIEWEEFGITELLQAEDGHEALEIIRRHKPVVVFCDMKMPGMNGIELLGHIREWNKETQIIVISGHDDFQYTRAAIKANGVDYILKPFAKRDVEQALKRAIAAWTEREENRCEQRETNFRLSRADALIDEQKLVDYIKGEITYHEGLNELFNRIGLPDHRLLLALVLPRNRKELLNRRFQGDAELFIFAVNNITHEMIKPYGSYYLCRVDDYQWLLITALPEPLQTVREHRLLMDKVAAAWRETLGIHVLVGVSDHPVSIEKLTTSIGEAAASLLQCSIYPSDGSKEQHSSSISVELPRLKEQEFLLQTALRGGNIFYAEDIIRSFTQKLRERGTLRLKDLQACTVEANLLLERANRERSGKEAADMLMPLWISDLDEWQTALIARWQNIVRCEQGNHVGNIGIEAIRDYIEEHFDKDLSLSSLAERFNFSPQYMNKKFKDTYGNTLMSYLTQLRMDKAKSLLKHTNKQISVIAEDIGYVDENYFSKVFRKKIGTSPLQFRKQSRDS